MNPNPRLRESKNWWDSIMSELIELVLHRGYRLKDLSKHFGRSVGAISSALHNRDISLVSLRYNHAKESSK